jgi:hypothetical protein
MAPLVSVVMSVYNGARFLRPAIESILNQTFRNLEFIVVDDGSTDETRDIVSSYVDIDERVVLVRQDNRGQAAALNRGCAMARADYIARMDADDVAVSSRIERQIAFLQEHRDIGLLGGAVQEIDAHDNPQKIMVYPTTDQEIKQCEMEFCCFAHPAVMFRKQTFADSGGYRRAFIHADDYDLWLRLSERYHVANLQEIVLYYRTHGDQITSHSLRQQLISALGAKVAARARRAGKGEPFEPETPLTMADLRSCSVSREEIGQIFSGAFQSVASRMPTEHVNLIALDFLGDAFIRDCVGSTKPQALVLMYLQRLKYEFRQRDLRQCGLSFCKMISGCCKGLEQMAKNRITRMVEF